jgi:hypothetical protein
MNVLACPHCGRQFQALPDVLGTTIRCRGCRQTFQVSLDLPPQASRSPERPTANPPAAAEGVFAGSAVRSCPQCGHTFSMQPRLEGKAIRCRKCRSTFRVLSQVERAPGPEGAMPPPVPPPPPAPTAATHGDHRDPVDQFDEDDAFDHAPREINMWPPVAVPGPWLRRRSRSAGGLGELVAVLVGGLLAFPATQLICWWGLDWDPFGVAARLRPELRWLAPDHLLPPAAQDPNR